MNTLSTQKIKVLDCTLRDGGYYNQWDFESSCAKDLVHALSQTGVSIVELGYKSGVTNGFYGIFKYCAESQLAFLSEYPNLQFAFMLDVKEFVCDNGKLNVQSIEKIIRP